MNKNFDIQFKILVVGDSACGKTSTIIRYTNDLFSPTFITTIGIDFKIKYINQDNKKIKLIIWDTAGQERFRTITTSFFRGANALIVLYSVDNRLSFENIKGWIEEINKYLQKPYYVLVANKIDIDEHQRVISESEGRALAKNYNVPYYEISAKKGTNVNLPFEYIAKTLIESTIYAQKSAQKSSQKSVQNSAHKQTLSHSYGSVDIKPKTPIKISCCK
jgi:small GTP-binding protein